jgi:hypothetical protein
LPAAPRKKQRPISVVSFQVGAPGSQPSQAGSVTVWSAICGSATASSRKFTVAASTSARAQNSRKIPSRKPKSPMRFTMKALLPQ